MPLQAPLHETLVWPTVNVIAGGFVNVTVFVLEQPFMSETITVCMPAHKPQAVCEF